MDKKFFKTAVASAYAFTLLLILVGVVQTFFNFIDIIFYTDLSDSIASLLLCLFSVLITVAFLIFTAMPFLVKNNLKVRSASLIIQTVATGLSMLFILLSYIDKYYGPSVRTGLIQLTVCMAVVTVITFAFYHNDKKIAGSKISAPANDGKEFLSDEEQ